MAPENRNGRLEMPDRLSCLSVVRGQSEHKKKKVLKRNGIGNGLLKVVRGDCPQRQSCLQRRRSTATNRQLVGSILGKRLRYFSNQLACFYSPFPHYADRWLPPWHPVLVSGRDDESSLRPQPRSSVVLSCRTRSYPPPASNSLSIKRSLPIKLLGLARSPTLPDPDSPPRGAASGSLLPQIQRLEPGVHWPGNITKWNLCRPLELLETSSSS